MPGVSATKCLLPVKVKLQTAVCRSLGECIRALAVVEV
jgi:hypothetical protein